jgi:hypothetical protein
VIKLSIEMQTEEQFVARKVIEEMWKNGDVHRQLDPPNYCYTFINSEDEIAFVLKYGNDLRYKVNGFYYCPYIPLISPP